MAVSVAIETPLQDDVRRLVAALNAHLVPLSPPEFQFKMTVEQMAGEDTSVFVARREDGSAVGIGALKVHADGLGEVKRMYTDPTVRGQRAGSALLEAIVALARHKGLTRMMLETGEGPGFAGAFRLYERAGFTVRGAFLDYPASEWSRFYEMALSPEVSA
ncbi:GNAT family N-acetyltransferase [Devosia rhodophyticola]|uniref:GNAT family N-acetyltransferase n=1 Tax=Devosia rhodophyticola TaxID=3026423 RepID=A0ABY7YWV1_9HYPH|nr:GNAT family N-acetyltransferase [Devosia rhodophyticola]WDR05716.1 GNAT family N-acetyltransferase [Devosia rhodophyticola]